MSTLKKTWILDTEKYDVIMTSDNVIAELSRAKRAAEHHG